jgi:hypothetical protein
MWLKGPLPGICCSSERQRVSFVSNVPPRGPCTYLPCRAGHDCPNGHCNHFKYDRQEEIHGCDPSAHLQMRSPELPAAATFAVFVLLLLLPTQIRVRNVAILAPMTCMILTNITYLVNTLVWAENVRDVAPIWCDISQSLSTLTEIVDGKLRSAAATNIWFLAQYVVGGAALCICVQRCASVCSLNVSHHSARLFCPSIAGSISRSSFVVFFQLYPFHSVRQP